MTSPLPAPALLIFAVATSLSLASRAQSVEFASFGKTSDLSAFLSGGELRGGSETYSKLALVFREPREIKSVQFDSCDGEIKNGLEVFLAPGFRYHFVEGGTKKIKVETSSDPVKSIAIVFKRNRDFCVKNFKLVPRKGPAPALTAPEVVEAKLKPDAEITELLDSRPQTEPASFKEIAVEFASPRPIDRLRVWQGLGPSRAKSVGFAADGAPARVFEVATSSGAQDLKLESPVTAKKVVVTAKDGVLSELRFANGEQEFVPALPVSQETELRRIASSSLASMLDLELSARVDEKDVWLFRFRSDGTFFIRGFGEDMTEARAFSALGSYRIEKQTKKGARLRLYGVRVPTANAWDGVLCPFECGGAVDRRDVSIDEVVELEEAKGGAIMVRNRTARAKRTLPFSDLKSQNSAFEE